MGNRILLVPWSPRAPSVPSVGLPSCLPNIWPMDISAPHLLGIATPLLRLSSHRRRARRHRKCWRARVSLSEILPEKCPSAKAPRRPGRESRDARVRWGQADGGRETEPATTLGNAQPCGRCAGCFRETEGHTRERPAGTVGPPSGWRGDPGTERAAGPGLRSCSWEAGDFRSNPSPFSL